MQKRPTTFLLTEQERDTLEKLRRLAGERSWSDLVRSLLRRAAADLAVIEAEEVREGAEPS